MFLGLESFRVGLIPEVDQMGKNARKNAFSVGFRQPNLRGPGLL